MATHYVRCRFATVSHVLMYGSALRAMSLRDGITCANAWSRTLCDVASRRNPIAMRRQPSQNHVVFSQIKYGQFSNYLLAWIYQSIWLAFLLARVNSSLKASQLNVSPEEKDTLATFPMA